MNAIHTVRRYFLLSAVSLSVMAAAFLVMPLVSDLDESGRPALVAVGAVFWLSAIIGYGFLFLANRRRKQFILRRYDGNLSMGCRPGLITFFQNKPAAVADVTMAVSLLLLIIVGLTDWNNSYLVYVLLFLFLLSFHMHGLLNGRIYKTTKLTRTEITECKEREV